MKGIAKGLMSLVIVAACLAFIPVVARVGLLILSTAPNPRHPPADVMGEAVGWAIVGAVVGTTSVIIGESVVMREERGILAAHRGLVLGSVSDRPCCLPGRSLSGASDGQCRWTSHHFSEAGSFIWRGGGNTGGCCWGYYGSDPQARCYCVGSLQPHAYQILSCWQASQISIQA
jgi:hypothetical protein